MIEVLVAGKPMTADEAYGQAVGCYARGSREEAKSLLERIVAIAPEHAPAQNGLAIIALDEGRTDEAHSYAQRALELDPSLDKARNTMGNVLLRLGRSTEALESYRLAISLNPLFAEAYANLGRCLETFENWDDAAKAYRKAAKLRPHSWQFHYHYAIALEHAGDTATAEEALRITVGLNPAAAEPRVSLGLILVRKGMPEKALDMFREATVLAPSFPFVWEKMSELLIQMGLLHEAKEALARAESLGGETVETLTKRGGILYFLGKPVEAVETYRKALSLDSGAEGARSAMIFTMNYSTTFSATDIFRESCEWERILVGGVARGQTFPDPPDKTKKLRVGYVSPDFRDHPVSHFFLPLIEGHSRSAIEVFCYSDVPTPDATTYILRTLSDNWRDVHAMNDQSLADTIREDRIDILVDLAGHSAGSRLSMFALKPAPVQVSWLGYPATTGLSAIDYRITDAIADPEGEADLVHTEKLVRLPDGFLCYAPPEYAPPLSPPPSEEKGFVTFGTFNNPAKLSPESIRMWASILRALPTSRLLLKNKIFREDKTREMFLDLLQDAGIARSRVTCLPHTASTGAHLETYRSLDISLDTYPYNGTTTTCESLWMGVPVVTLLGDRHASRVSASILARLSLGDLIAGSEEEYAEIALRLAADAKRLQSLRKGLRKTMKSSPLCDRRRFSRQMEEAYRQMFHKWSVRRSD